MRRSPYAVCGGAALTVLALLASAAGCPERGTPGAAPAPTDAAVRSEGFVRIADVMRPVAPFVIHDPKQDLFTLCQIGTEAARDKGVDLPLCYDPAARTLEGVRTVRVEIVRASVGRAMQSVAAAGEGAHFAVDRTGTIYQVLDLAYAARRDGAPRPDEIRVISTGPDVHAPLLATLTALSPKLRVEVIEITGAPAPPPTGGP